MLLAGNYLLIFTPTYRSFSSSSSSSQSLIPSFATSQLPPLLPHSLLANLPCPTALPLCAQPTSTFSRHSPIDVCIKGRRIAPSAFSSSVATRTWTLFHTVGAISIRRPYPPNTTNSSQQPHNGLPTLHPEAHHRHLHK